MSSFPVLPPSSDNAGLMTARQMSIVGRQAILLEWTWDTPHTAIPSSYDELIQFVDPLGDPADPYNQSPGVPGYQVIHDIYLGDQQTGYSGADAQTGQRLLFWIPTGQEAADATLYFGAYNGDTSSEIFCGINYVALTDLVLLPDVEAEVINFLRNDPDVLASDLSDRIYGKLPQDKIYPLARVTQVTSNMLVQVPPAEFEQVTLQIDVWGGTKADTKTAAQTLRAVLAHRFVQPGIEPASAVDLGSLAWLPDQDFDPPKARYTSDVLVTVRAST